MTNLFLLPTATAHDAGIDAWMNRHTGELGALAQAWFAFARQCGEDVQELMHDGHPTLCVAGAAFAYVGAFKAHASVGFFQGASLPDPAGLLQGSGKAMRHVKLVPGHTVDQAALERLVRAAYADIKARLAAQ
jgi:hypothetical protein